MQKIKFFIVSTLFLGLIPSCCDQVLPFIQLNGISHDILVNSMPSEELVLEDQDDLKLELHLTEFEYISEKSFLNLFTSNSYALSCEPDGHNGLKSQIIGIDIRSNNHFLNHWENTSIIEEFSFSYVFFRKLSECSINSESK